MYKSSRDRVNVNYGKINGPQKFFEMNTYDYQEVVPGFNPKQECYAYLNKSSEGALYPQGITKSTILWYFRKTLCRPVPLFYEGEIQRDPLVGYKFALKGDTYDRKKNLTADCYKGFITILPDGLSDMSKCYYNLPMAASLPHFLYREGSWMDRLEGLNATKDVHESYAVIEPTFGRFSSIFSLSND